MRSRTRWWPSPGSMAGSCGASTARACARSTRPTSSARSIPACSRIKAAFDPHDQLNPGKIATPADGSLLRIDEVPTRGGRERAIPPGIRESYDNALHCNGNGACYDFDLDAAMCPSWKGTRERRHSPKGRASLMREWLRLMVAEGADPVAEAASFAPRRAWRTLASPDRQHDRQAPRRLRLLARGQGDDGRLPRLQGVRRPVPDQGRRAGLPGEVPRALSRPLSAPGEGRPGRRDRASPARWRRGCRPSTTSWSAPRRANSSTDGWGWWPCPSYRACASIASLPAAGSGPRRRRPWLPCPRRSGRAALSWCRTPSPAISSRGSCSTCSISSRGWASGPGWRRSDPTASPSTCMAFSAASSAWRRATPPCSAPLRPRACRWSVSTRR